MIKNADLLRSASEHYVIKSLASIKRCVDPPSRHKWFGLFHSSSAAGWSYIFADIGQTDSKFPLSVQMQFYVWASRGKECENIFWQYIDVWTVASSFHKHTKPNINTNKNMYAECMLRRFFYDVLFKEWFSVFVLREQTLTDIQRSIRHQRKPHK